MKNNKHELAEFNKQLVTHYCYVEVSQEEIAEAEVAFKADPEAFFRIREQWGMRAFFAKYGAGELLRLKYSPDGKKCSHFAFGFDVIEVREFGLTLLCMVYPIYEAEIDVGVAYYSGQSVT